MPTFKPRKYACSDDSCGAFNPDSLADSINPNRAALAGADECEMYSAMEAFCCRSTTDQYLCDFCEFEIETEDSFVCSFMMLGQVRFETLINFCLFLHEYVADTLFCRLLF